ncbi:Ger(x)C family spore germination protein [Paenibacillus alginolyticus]|uniref:Ger(x)C family spore germination protein n=1 Tax=Paenibacillus alginolyticus TaxID=59839 RepID=UPI000427067A|nr:Ger(x)C family spore germination protein [Paenibacillus alginolyticus]MCY9665774.1 Ger(x)C family spore germination protein [Paenibacillus alginolyticus]
MLKRIFSILLLFSFANLTGCWDRKELNELGIVTAIGIDKTKNQYELSIQLLNPGEIANKSKGGGNRASVTLYQENAETLFKALRKMSMIAPRTLYLSHLQMVVIGEEMAKDGIGDALDVLYRGYQTRPDFYLTIVKGSKARDVLKILLPVEKIPTQNLFSKLETSNKLWAATGTVKLDELINDIVSKGKDPVITAIEIIGDKKEGNKQENLQAIDVPTRLIYSGMAVFKKDKLVGWLNQEESKGFNYTQEKHVKKTFVQFPCPGGRKEFAGVEILRTKTETKAKIDEGKPIIYVSFHAEGNIGEVQCQNVDLTDTKTIERFEKGAEQDIQSNLENVFKKAHTLKTDVFGFGEIIERSNPKQWGKLAERWNDDGFMNASVHFKVKVKIKRVGTVTNSYLKEME